MRKIGKMLAGISILGLVAGAGTTEKAEAGKGSCGASSCGSKKGFFQKMYDGIEGEGSGKRSCGKGSCGGRATSPTKSMMNQEWSLPIFFRVPQNIT